VAGDPENVLAAADDCWLACGDDLNIAVDTLVNDWNETQNIAFVEHTIRYEVEYHRMILLWVQRRRRPPHYFDFQLFPVMPKSYHCCPIQ
jgi:hypothetical protein